MKALPGSDVIRKDQQSIDERYMRRCIALARKGRRATEPNPMVGSVIVRNGSIIGEGYHRRFGSEHAEVAALRNAGSNARGATLYVNLEPCNHTGKTPPCSRAIIEAGISRIVVGARDPNPVATGGIATLRASGIRCTTGVLRDESISLNERFFVNTTEHRPYVILKYAQSLDGYIALPDGSSRWITGTAARREAHRLRADVDAVLIGAGTLRRDNSRLTVRNVRGNQPMRVVLTNDWMLPLDSAMFKNPGKSRTIVVGPEPRTRNQSAIAEKLRLQINCVLMLPQVKRGYLPLKKVLAKLLGNGIFSILVEGGSHILTSFVESGLYDRVEVFLAPIVLGAGIPALGVKSGTSIGKSLAFRSVRCKRLGDDFQLSFTSVKV